MEVQDFTSQIHCFSSSVVRSEEGKREEVPSWKHEATGTAFPLSETNTERVDMYLKKKLFIKDLI